ncbi:HDL362Cp [Eremothecium sinecaudum]|uniref:HDL362Cp n=1 Tax=Eremothecium sinecaudum TaxID=45286 RepID=A0A0X8HRZ8_9SACH|nr:HDL362Cp [Eremothecium sinecaudum]AMD20382.1 HDL362Cp [Eremothecium sinecaudum]
MTSNNSSTLHELATTNFNRTPDNLIFSDDLKKVYSILLICLELDEKPRDCSKKLFNTFSKTYPYAFSVHDAVEKMGNLKLYVDMNSTTVHISYTINREQAYSMLRVFMDAKLLHTPADRTRDEPKDNVLLQPTPKGVAILQRFVIHMGIKKKPPILSSAFNSMQLFTFERSSVNDAIIQSDYFIQLLFIKMMGRRPNVWTPTNPNDKLPTLAVLTEQSNDIFSFENRGLDFTTMSFGSSSAVPDYTECDNIASEKHKDTNRESPFAHRFFTNPDSDAHSQYYVSDSGLRICKSKVFGKYKTAIDYSFTTKAIWQWLMDCTDLMYPKEAVLIAALFLKVGLILPILLPPSLNVSKKFTISKFAYYTLSKLGRDIIQWNIPSNTSAPVSYFKIQVPDHTKINTDFTITGSYVIGSDQKSLTQSETDSEKQSSEERPIVDLSRILKDPGLRYLFRRHLENEFCAENFDVYIEIKKFSKKMTILKTLLESKAATEQRNMKNQKLSHPSQKIIDTIDSALTGRANECLAIAYHIFSTYIITGAPFQLNIDHALRVSITNIMIHPKSPLSKTFNERGINPFDENTIDVQEAQYNYPSSHPSLDQLSSKDNVNVTTVSTLPELSTSPLQDDGFVSHKKAPVTDVLDFNNHFQISPESSPSTLVNSLQTLKELYVLFDEVGKHMYRLMKIDSVPKFLNSEVYEEVVSLIQTSHS